MDALWKEVYKAIKVKLKCSGESWRNQQCGASAEEVTGGEQSQVKRKIMKAMLITPKEWGHWNPLELASSHNLP